MCRIAAYFGPRLRLSALLSEPEHSLEQQSRNARQMDDGSVAGDGWGVGWFTEDEEGAPGMLKSILPLWSDLNARTATHAIASRCVVGHIRFASVGSEVCFTNTPLYSYGPYLYTMNGELKPWPGALSRALRGRLRGEDEAGVSGHTDAEMFGALWHTCFCRGATKDVGDALRTALRQARDLALEHDGSVRASVIVAGADGFVAARFGEPKEPPTLYSLTAEERWHGGSLVASEPLDDGPGWKAVPPNFLVRGDRHGLRIERLELESAAADAGAA